MRRSLDFSVINAAALPALPALCARRLDRRIGVTIAANRAWQQSRERA